MYLLIIFNMMSENINNNCYLENGFYLTNKNVVNKETHCHYTRNLRNNKYKINIIISRPGWTYEIFKTYYFPNQQKIGVLDYNFKLLEPKVKSVYSLKYCGKEQVYDYYLKYINKSLMSNNVFWN
jgi:hypothetical protein